MLNTHGHWTEPVENPGGMQAQKETRRSESCVMGELSFVAREMSGITSRRIWERLKVLELRFPRECCKMSFSNMTDSLLSEMD